MSICDKINTAGETLEANLTARGISCDFGKNSDGKDTIQDMAEMITASNLRGIGDAIIHISASRPYLLSGEKTDLIVTLHNGVGTPLANKSVTVSDGTSVYSGITNNQGIFTLLDIGVTGDTTFTATYGTVSATCLVEYCTFVDYAVKDNHNHNYFNQAGTSKVTITEADEYKEFKTISTIAGNVYIGSSTSSTGFDVGDTWTIIWDKLYIDGYTVAFQCYNGSTTFGINSTALLLHNSDFQELKFVCDGSSIKAYVDGVYKTQTSYTSTGHGYLRINLNNNNGASQVTFRAKNIRILSE